MNEQEPLIEEPRLFENLCSTFYLGIGFELVKRNRGAPGIDGVSIADFEANLDEEPVATGIDNLDLSTRAGAPGGNPQAGRQGGAFARHPDGSGPRGPGHPEKAAGADLRPAFLTAQLRFPSRTKPTPSGASGAGDCQ